MTLCYIISLVFSVIILLGEPYEHGAETAGSVRGGNISPKEQLFVFQEGLCSIEFCYFSSRAIKSHDHICAK
jgi:hypothetical protein